MVSCGNVDGGVVKDQDRVGVVSVAAGVGVGVAAVLNLKSANGSAATAVTIKQGKEQHAV